MILVVGLGLCQLNAVATAISVEKESPHYLQAVLPTKEVGGEVLVPLRQFLALTGVTEVTWKDEATHVKGGEVVIGSPANFDIRFLSNLQRGIGTAYGDRVTPLPAGVIPYAEAIGSLPEASLPSPKDIQEKSLLITIESQGNVAPFVTYSYSIEKEDIYIAPAQLTSLGLIGMEVAEEGKAVVTYQTQEQIKELVAKAYEELQAVLATLSPDDIIQLWIRAQQTRSGALQYSLMSPTLQAAVLPDIQERGWVTGGSSPTLVGGQMTTNVISELPDRILYQISLESMLQGKVYETLSEVVILEQQAGRWYIVHVTGNTGYYTYEEKPGSYQTD